MKFKCQSSCGGKCCTSPNDSSYVFLTMKDIALIEKHTGQNSEDFVQGGYFDETRFGKFSKPKWIWFLKDSVNKACRFLNNGKCTIYDARPTQCRTFPFWPELMSLKAQEEVGKTCPGVGKGKELRTQFVIQKVKEQKQADKEY